MKLIRGIYEHYEDPSRERECGQERQSAELSVLIEIAIVILGLTTRHEERATTFLVAALPFFVRH